MKRFIFIIFAFIYTCSIWGQKRDIPVISKASSEPIKIAFIGADTLVKIPAVQSSPKLEISELSFTGLENDGFISAEEKGYLHFTISNRGQDNAYNLRLSVSEKNNLTGLVYNNNKFICQVFEPGETRTDSIFIEGRTNLDEGKANFELVLSEANGYKSQIVSISLFTRQFSKPKVDIIDHEFYSTKNDRELNLRITVKNTGSRNINNAKVNIEYPKSVYVNGNQIKTLSLLKPDDSETFEYIFAKNQEIIKRVFRVTIEDNNGRGLGDSGEMVYVDGLKKEEDGDIDISVDMRIPMATSDLKNGHIYVLIIGNEDYSNNKKVPHAINDARIFGIYCNHTYNIPKKNINILTNATGNQMREALGALARKAKYDDKEKAELIIYYSGHGIIAKDKYSKEPDEFDQYLIPCDVSRFDPGLYISRKEIYSVLNDVSFKRASIFLDACNIPGDRGALIKEAKYEWRGNVFVFASSAPWQTSITFNEKKHGLFTYFLLKSIQEKGGKINYNDLTKLVIENVKRQADNMTKEGQTPEVKTSPQTGESWKRWKIAE